MKRFIELIKKSYKGIIKTLMLIVSIMIIVYIFPREAKFRFEFSKGKPWMYEDLFAEYNVPIYKSELELTSERDSILQQYIPFFMVDNTVFEEQMLNFNVAFENHWRSYISKKYNIDEPSSGRARLAANLNQTRVKYLEFASGILSFIYSKGVLDAAEILPSEDVEVFPVFVVNDNLAEEFNYTDLFTQKKAYEYSVDQIGKYNSENRRENSQASDFYKGLNLSDFIYPNLFYDEVKSETEKQSLLDRISLTAGMIQQGERIISRGEVVTASKYRVLESMKREYENRSGTTVNRMMILLGQIILVAAIMSMLYLFLYHFRRETFLNNSHTFFVLLLIILFVVLIRLAVSSNGISYYFVPLVIVPIIIRTFFDSRLALFIYMILLMITGFLVPDSFEFVFLNFIAGIVAIFSMTNVYKRSIFFFTAGILFLTYSILYLGMGIIQEGNLNNIDWYNFAWFGGNCALILLSYPLIFVFEKTFGFLSDATLLEIADTNQPLLRDLAEKAPGTFQHSLQVANLSEYACRTVGGNPLLVRTAALYHDIGKMKDPLYFIENQSGGYNPHDSLNFEDSAAIIIGHVTKGVEIANKNKIPEPLIDFIRTHHGTTKVQYFYRSFIKSYPEELVDDKKFSYPGPRPFTKEMAILMMADSVEAASRSLKDVDGKAINDLVDKIIDSQFEEGQFNESPITLVDITRIKGIFKKRLSNIYHVRIEYPESPK
ncbi:MAG: HDIG domain-containing protein [Bacteroidales bacterium]|nr:HDIG domain-containing protein [Bacteroidales bacterium]